MQLESKSLAVLEEALKTLDTGFAALPGIDNEVDLGRLRNVLLEVAGRLKDNYPYFHPYYAGQMLKPPHPLARLAYTLAIWINPNNHALDGGRASSFMEKEAIAEMASMFGWQQFLGHLCGGGTIANLEALWVAGRLKPGLKIVASEQAHYTHQRISEVLQLDFQPVPCDSQARMDVEALVRILDRGNVSTVVATIGTTGTGSVDPLLEILELREKYDFRLHADAAYGGYFTLVDNLDETTRKAYDCLPQVDSIAIDPHKHGLQPYGCGCILFKDPGVGVLYKHDSPYTYFSSSELHLGEISLECSRPGASAVALWATHRLLPLVRGGEFAMNLAKSRQAALLLYEKLSNDSRFKTMFKPELDIVVWAPQADRTSVISKLSLETFKTAAEANLHLATFNYPTKLLKNTWSDIVLDQDYVTCLRSCLMKPQHLDWLEHIWQILDRVINKVIAKY
jgi:tyrosine decarboxylase/aspartate 1-decarboxylase